MLSNSFEIVLDVTHNPELNSGEGLLKCELLEDHYRASRLKRLKTKAGDVKWGVNKTDKITRYKMASGRRVSDDTIFEPRLSAPP